MFLAVTLGVIVVKSSQTIKEKKEKILSLWRERILEQVPAAGRTTGRTLRNSLPAYLDHLSDALSTNCKTDVRSVLAKDLEAIRLGKLHSADRADHTEYLLTEVISDYHILRKVILEVLEASEPLPGQERDIILDSIDQAVNVSSVKFSELQASRVQDLKLSDSALDSVPDALVIIREDATIGYINHQTETWFGYDRGELFGKELEILIPERFRETHRHKRSKYAENPTPRPMGSGLELYGRRKDGSEFPVDITIGPLKVGDHLYYMAIVRDVTEKKKLEIERDLAIGAREELVALVTHDLKNPLSAIALGSELLGAHMGAHQADAKSSLILKSITTATDRMFHLIQSILTQKKMEFGGFIVEKSAGSVADLLDEVVAIMEPIAVRKSLCLQKKDLPPGLRLICNYDRERVKQVLENLIDNAIKFTPAGGTITIQSLEDNAFIRFSITDTGPGLTADTISHLFTAYYQPKETAHQGTGLGLSICKGIVEAHGGTIWADSIFGQGASFNFTLPIQERLQVAA